MNFLHFLAKPFIGVAAAATLGVGATALAHHDGQQNNNEQRVNTSLVTTAHVDTDNDNDSGHRHAVVSTTASLAIGPKGMAHIMGAKVTSLASSSIGAVLAWGSTNIPVVIDTTSNTKIAGGATLASMKVGDRVNASGSLNTSASQLTLDANVLHDVSLK